MDPREPGRKLGVTPEAIEMGEGADPSLLDHVLGLGIVLDHAAGHTEETAVMPLHDKPDRGLVPASRQIDQSSIVQAVQRRRRNRRDPHGQAPVSPH